MSQTVIIPSCMNPFEITINNHTYSFKAGESVEMPDDVAEVIKHHVDSVPKPLDKEEGSEGSSVDVQPIEITENGTYTAPSGVAYSPIEVNVASSGGGVNKLAQVADGSVTKIIASDLQGATNFKRYMFYECRNLTDFEMPNGVELVDEYAFSYCTSLKNATISNSVKSIARGVFSHCEKLESIIIPDSVTNLGQDAFEYNAELKSVSLPNNITTLSAYLFNKCYKLNNVMIPNAVTSIGNQVFRDCRALTIIEIPSGVTSIGNASFRDCISLTKVVVRAETPPTIYTESFKGVPTTCIYEVPAASVDAYKAETNWSTLADQIVASEEF